MSIDFCGDIKSGFVYIIFNEQVLGPRLPALLPVLVRGMRYSEMDVILLRGDRDDDADDAEPDRETDIRPRFHKPRSHTIKHNGNVLI